MSFNYLLPLWDLLYIASLRHVHRLYTKENKMKIHELERYKTKQAFHEVK